MNGDTRQRSDRTPMTDAGDVIGAISDLYLALNPEKTIRDFTNLLDPYFAELLVDGDSIIDSWNESDFPENFPIQMHIALAFCGQAARNHFAGEEQRAWTYAFDAAIWLGNTLSALHDKLLPPQPSSLSENGRRAADVRHEENRKVRAKAIQMFLDGRFSSKNQAAVEISKKVARSHAVVRRWLGKMDG